MQDLTVPLILLADDDRDIRELIKTVLEGGPWRILEARDGEEALETILIEQPALVILDVMMPGLNGWEITKYVKSHRNLDGVKILLLTGVGATVNSLTAPLYGADDSCDKPFDVDDLEARVRRLLDLPREGRND